MIHRRDAMLQLGSACGALTLPQLLKSEKTAYAETSPRSHAKPNPASSFLCGADSLSRICGI
jgi:hypothetical protein